MNRKTSVAGINLANLPSALIKGFAFFKKSGGTGQSNGGTGEKFGTTVNVLITKCWLDDEIGIRFFGIATAATPMLAEYLERNCGNYKTVFFGGDDLVDSMSVIEYKEYFDQFRDEKATAVRTEDGFIFRKQADGTWGDDDMSFDQLSDITGGENFSLTVVYDLDGTSDPANG